MRRADTAELQGVRGENLWRQQMRPLDTTIEADALQRQIWRRLGGPSRLRLALDMSVAARTLTLARLRRRHPDYSNTT